MPFLSWTVEAKAKMVTAAGSLAQVKAMAPNRRRQHNRHTLVVIKTKQKLPLSLKYEATFWKLFIKCQSLCTLLKTTLCDKAGINHKGLLFHSDTQRSS